jgi:hypothetical protein
MLIMGSYYFEEKCKIHTGAKHNQTVPFVDPSFATDFCDPKIILCLGLIA